MSTDYFPELSNLDEIRLKNGVDKLKDKFDSLLKSRSEKAISLINSEDLQFPSLFVLQSEIKKHDLLEHLNQRNKAALEIKNQILSREFSDENRLYKENQNTLKWILETGYTSDGLNAHYDEVLDKTAILLVKVYNNKDCLNYLEKLIFNRYRRGSFIYDLVWAFFESRSSDCLYMISKRLLSGNSKDIELARKLLNFIPSVAVDCKGDNVKQYHNTLKWINQNLQYLYYTGEHFLQTSTPCPFIVSLKSKYLQKPTWSESSRAYSENELILLEDFKGLDSESQTLLSSFSGSLYRKSRSRWSRWLCLPITKQLETAKRMGGELV